MRGRPSSRTRYTRSSLTAAVSRPGARRPTHGDRRGVVSEQLTLALDLASPAPRLVVSDQNVDTGPPDTRGPHIASLGAVLAQVLSFHEAFDLPREPLPTTYVGDSLAQLRVRLLREEVEEFAHATQERDLVAIADALADIVYVAYGSAVTYGIDLDAVVREVHRSNMSKLDANGRPVLREDGKVLKSSRYRPPDVANVVDVQLPLFDLGCVMPRSSGTGAPAAAV